MSNDIYTQRDTLIAKASAALKKGDLETGRKLRQQAEHVQATIDELKALEGMKALPNSARPPLPGSERGAIVNQMAGRQGGESNTVDRQRAAYVVRFGEPEAAVKGILTDLHGPDYEAQYWQQSQAFRKFLRMGDRQLDADEHRLLKSIILTPAVVKQGMMKGIDSVDAIKATMVEAIDVLGGYAVPVDFQARVIERVKGLTIMRGRASEDETSRDTVELPVSTGGDDQYTSAVRVTWVDETPAAGQAATNLTFGLERIPIHTVMAETGLSRNMVEDAAFDIESYLVKKFAESSAIDEDNKFLTGTGVGTPQGILPGGTNALALTEAKSGSAAALTWDGLIALRFAIPTQYRKNAVWIANRATYEAIAKLRNAATNDYLWQPYQYTGGGEHEPEKLMGYPVLEQENMPDVAANSYPIVFCDPGGYQIFDRVGMTVERFLDSATARQNMIMYVMRRRLGAQILEPWRFAVQKVSA